MLTDEGADNPQSLLPEYIFAIPTYILFETKDVLLHFVNNTCCVVYAMEKFYWLKK